MNRNPVHPFDVRGPLRIMHEETPSSFSLMNASFALVLQAVITCLAFSTDGRHLVTGSEDGTLFFLQATPSAWAPVG
jgi:WD40 repeat protein